VTGIPVHPQFGKSAAGTEKGSPNSPFRILVLGGGYTTKIVLDLAETLARLCAGYGATQFHVDLVCGRNERLYASAKRIASPANLRWRRYQFISYVDRLMDSADVVITKSGGLTVSESLAKGLPMVIFDPVPGQEGHNAAYLMEHGAACAAYGYAQLAYKIKQLIDDPSLLDRMKSSASAIAKPLAAKVIWEEVLGDNALR
jgi:processive 1,2-diacylglycerol beta-glucosyltransferase